MTLEQEWFKGDQDYTWIKKFHIKRTSFKEYSTR